MKKLLILLCTIFVLTSCSSNESKASEIIEKYEGMTFISETEVPEKIKETSLVSQDHMRFSIIKIGPNEKYMKQHSMEYILMRKSILLTIMQIQTVSIQTNLIIQTNMMITTK